MNAMSAEARYAIQLQEHPSALITIYHHDPFPTIV